PTRGHDMHSSQMDSVPDYGALRLLLPSVRRRVLGADALVVGVGLTPNPANAKGEIDYTLVEDDVDPVAVFDAARDRPRLYAALDARETAEGRPASKPAEDVPTVGPHVPPDACHGH